MKNFDALIGVGTAWPASTSLAAHLLNVHMGRLLEAHRSTSRSNDALYLEHVALRSGAMFNYLKMALGVVPFVGTAIALYDAWNSANLAVAAFLRGDVGHGLAEVEAVLLSLIDAAMDVLPVAGATSSAARAATRGRQLRALTKQPGALQVSTRSRCDTPSSVSQVMSTNRRFPLPACNRVPKGFIATFIATLTATS